MTKYLYISKLFYTFYTTLNLNTLESTVINVVLDYQKFQKY